MDLFFGRSQRLVILTAGLAWGYFCCVGEFRDGLKGISVPSIACSLCPTLQGAIVSNPVLGNLKVSSDSIKTKDGLIPNFQGLVLLSQVRRTQSILNLVYKTFCRHVLSTDITRPLRSISSYAASIASSLFPS